MKLDIRKFFAKKENIYLPIALTAGLLMAILNPPFSGVPDEHAHYLKAWSIAEGNLKCSGDTSIPAGAYSLADDIKPVEIEGLEDKKISGSKLKENLFESRSQDKKEIGDLICGVSPLSYLPQITGLTLGSALGASELASFYLARIFNLLTAILLVYWAIKLMPFGKIIFLVLGLLPMTLQQFASLSYDSLHISSVFLLIAYIFNVAYGNGSVTRKQKAILLLLSLSVLLVKPGYFMLSGLVFLLPQEKFRGKAQFILFGLGVFLANFLSFLTVRRFFTDTADVFKEKVDPGMQLQYVLSNPFQFLNAVLETIYSKAIYFVETFLYKPGWLNNELPPLFYLFLILGIIFIIKNSSEEVRMKTWHRIFLFVLFTGNLLLVFLGLYTVWTEVGGEQIIGVQGRYFLSLAPLLILSLYKADLSLKFDFIKKHYNLLISIFFIIISLCSFYFIFKIYYDKSLVGKEDTYIYERQASTEEVRKQKTVKLSGPIAQKIIARKDYFSGLKIYIEKGQLLGDISFELRDGDCRDILDKKMVKKSMDEQSSIEIKFASRINSENQKFCIYSENLSANAPSLRVSENLYAEGELIVNKDMIKGNLVFDIIYKNL